MYDLKTDVNGCWSMILWGGSVARVDGGKYEPSPQLHNNNMYRF